ncbi:MAG TPA: DEAD/DEAH box helicase [Gammaproteobacteria bacterium]|nr:DEAD/DEAH box helicase [Gammaproteobacteria bacterium]
MSIRSTDSALAAFTPVVAGWFDETFGAPTAVQAAAWPAIASGRDVLVAAPTGSGKTFAAFLWALDGLARAAERGALAPGCRVLYVSPLKALSNDIRRNLEEPLAAIRSRLGPFADAIETAVRTGDTPASARERMRRRPPHILVTTPESLYLLLTSESGRRLLAPVETLIVDELHAVAGSKRGAHLALSLERLAALVARPLQRIGLSATQRPIERMGRFLVGAGREPPAIVDLGYARRLDLALEVPDSPLATVTSAEVWSEIYNRLATCVRESRSTLVFVNTRRLAERAGRHLGERLGTDAVAVHHGSLSRAEREQAEARLKAGELPVLIATASLELGIDIGEIDLVCQLGSPRSIATLLQRVGRSGHRLDAVPRGRLFPLTREDLLECTALLDAVAHDELEETAIGPGARDVLAQQTVAAVAGAGECALDDLYAVLTRAWPYRDLTREAFTEIVEMLALGFTTRRGRRLAHLSFDRAGGVLHARRGARRFALENGGVIPDRFDYDVRLLPENLAIGTVGEDFAFESLAGDIFQLGNRSYRVARVTQNTVFAEDANGAPPTIPFWVGEAPGRSRELSAAVSRLYVTAENALAQGDGDRLGAQLARIPGVPETAAGALAEYLAESMNALGCLPNEHRVILERFFDEVGDQHLVVHSPRGIRVNRAYGLALRKRFCRRFNFELQAAADDNALVLSLGATHSFPLAEVADYVKARDVREVLTQAVLTAPMFPARWRWVGATALALPRRRAGKRVPAPFQRADAEDLIALVFPEQLACQDNIVGEREVPDHPLVAQTMRECLDELMDAEGLEQLLAAREAGAIEVVACDLPEASPLARGIANARPWAFLDGGAAEERRTRAITPERAGLWAQALTTPDAAAVAQIRAEAWPEMRTAEELADALVLLGFVAEAEGREANAQPPFDELAAAGRAARMETSGAEPLWIAAERLPELLAVFPQAHLVPRIASPQTKPLDADEALRSLIRSRLEGLGPASADALARPLGLPPARIEAALAALEAGGGVMRGRFDPAVSGESWCDRHLAARLARLQLERRRSETRPVAPAAFQRFVLDWQGVGGEARGVEVLAAALERLAGFALPAGLWESEILPARLGEYRREDLDALLAGGRYVWARLAPPTVAARTGSLAQVPLAFVPRAALADWLTTAGSAPEAPNAAARAVEVALREGGALFWSDLREATGLLPSALEEALATLIRAGRASADHAPALRALMRPARRRRPDQLAGAGRFGLLFRAQARCEWTPERVEFFARVLLARYGIIFRALARREALMPPWRELLRAYWRLEARGEIRGGRFIAALAGEQFALPEALVPLARAEREALSTLRVVSAADPANLSAVLLLAMELPSAARLIFANGRPLAAFARGRYQALTPEGEHRRGELEACLRGAPSVRAHPDTRRAGTRAHLRAVSIAGR